MLKLLNRKSVLHLTLFTLLLISNWLISLIYFKFMNKYSKLYHLEESYQHFAQKSKQLEESSMRAQLNLEEWLLQNNYSSNKSSFGPLFNSLNTSQTKFMCVSILSKSRRGATSNYVNQAIMSLLTKTPLKLNTQLKMFAFNTDEPNRPNTNLLNMKHLIQIININANQSLQSTPRLKEALDYALALEYLHNESCQYSMLMEDDALIAFNWFDSLTRGLDYIRKNFNENEFIYMKLFSGYKFFDWEWLSFPFMVLKVAFYSLVLFCFNLSLILKLKFKLTNVKIFSLLVNSFSLCVVFYAISVAPCGFGVRLYSTGFGTVSLLIPNSKLLLLSRHLQTNMYGYLDGSVTKFNAKDILMDEFKVRNNFKEFIIEPSLVQHIGMQSSLYDREDSSRGYRQMYKSFSWPDGKKLIEFDLNFFK